MKIEVVHDLMKVYRRQFVSAEKFNDGKFVPHQHATSELCGMDDTTIIEHALWMVDQVDANVGIWTNDKIYRWLGFIQAILWMENLYTLDELRSHINATRPSGSITRAKSPEQVSR